MLFYNVGYLFINEKFQGITFKITWKVLQECLLKKGIQDSKKAALQKIAVPRQSMIIMAYQKTRPYPIQDRNNLQQPSMFLYRLNCQALA